MRVFASSKLPPIPSICLRAKRKNRLIMDTRCVLHILFNIAADSCRAIPSYRTARRSTFSQPHHISQTIVGLQHRGKSMTALSPSSTSTMWTCQPRVPSLQFLPPFFDCISLIEACSNCLMSLLTWDPSVRSVTMHWPWSC